MKIDMGLLREWLLKRNPQFRTEVRIEVNYLRGVHGTGAYAQAVQHGQDVRAGFYRRLVAREAAKQLRSDQPAAV